MLAFEETMTLQQLPSGFSLARGEVRAVPFQYMSVYSVFPPLDL